MYKIDLQLRDGSTMSDHITERPVIDTVEKSLTVHSTDGTESTLYWPNVAVFTLTKLENNVVPIRAV